MYYAICTYYHDATRIPGSPVGATVTEHAAVLFYDRSTRDAWVAEKPHFQPAKSLTATAFMRRHAITRAVMIQTDTGAWVRAI